MVQFQRRTVAAAVLVLIAGIVVTGCTSSTKEPPLPETQLAGDVFLGETGIPFDGAVAVVDHQVRRTYGAGRWVTFIEPGVYTVQINTVFGNGSYEAVVGSKPGSYENEYKVPLPDGFDYVVFNDLVFLNVAGPVPHQRVFRWPNGSTIRYWFDGGAPENRERFHRAVEEWLEGTRLVEWGKFEVIEMVNPAYANVVVSWGSETETDKQFNEIRQILSGVHVRIAEDEADDMLPYYVAVGEMMGLNKTLLPGTIMSVFAEPDATPSDMDRAYLMALYSMPQGFSWADAQW